MVDSTIVGIAFNSDESPIIDFAKFIVNKCCDSQRYDPLKNNPTLDWLNDGTNIGTSKRLVDESFNLTCPNMQLV